MRKGRKVQDLVETRNIQQWCPTVEAVVVLSVKGKVRGNLVEGEVVNCNLECAKKEGFCWKGKHILTGIW